MRWLTMPKIYTIAVAFIAMAIAFATAYAQENSAIEVVDRTFKMEMVGFSVTVPMPAWTRHDAEVSALEQSRITANKIRPGLTSLVFHRADENAVLWSELMGVLAIHVPGYTAGQQFKNIAEPLAARCMPGRIDLSWIVPLPGSDREALIGMCGRYNLQTQNAQPCVGGIIASVSVEHEQGVVSAYHEWCTQSFDVHDATKWPVSREEIQEHARQLQALTEFEDIAQ